MQCFVSAVQSGSYRVVNICHLQQVLGAAVLLHLDGLPTPLHGYAVVFCKVCIRRHLEVSTFEDDLVDVIFVFPKKKNQKKYCYSLDKKISKNLLNHPTVIE